jgi:hypothetical protein
MHVNDDRVMWARASQLDCDCAEWLSTFSQITEFLSAEEQAFVPDVRSRPSRGEYE